jgi:hypothetical protein
MRPQAEKIEHVCVLRPATEDDASALAEMEQRWRLRHFDLSTNPALVSYWRVAGAGTDYHARFWPGMTVADRYGAHVGVLQVGGNRIQRLIVDSEAHEAFLEETLRRQAERSIAAAGFRTAVLTYPRWHRAAIQRAMQAGYHEVGRAIEALTSTIDDELILLGRDLLSPEA